MVDAVLELRYGRIQWSWRIWQMRQMRSGQKRWRVHRIWSRGFERVSGVKWGVVDFGKLFTKTTEQKFSLRECHFNLYQHVVASWNGQDLQSSRRNFDKLHVAVTDIELLRLLCNLLEKKALKPVSSAMRIIWRENLISRWRSERSMDDCTRHCEEATHI